MVWALRCLQLPDLLLDGAGGDEAVGVDGAGLADAMSAVNGLRFDGRIPPRIVEDDVAGRGEVEAGAGGAEAEEEQAGIGILLEGLHHVLTVLGFAGQQVGGDFPRFRHSPWRRRSIRTNWLKTRTFCPSASSGSSSSNRVSVYRRRNRCRRARGGSRSGGAGEGRRAPGGGCGRGPFPERSAGPVRGCGAAPPGRASAGPPRARSRGRSSMRSGKSLATCFLRRRSMMGRSLAESLRRAMRWFHSRFSPVGS